MNLQAMHDLTKARMKSGAAIARDVATPRLTPNALELSSPIIRGQTGTPARLAVPGLTRMSGSA